MTYLIMYSSMNSFMVFDQMGFAEADQRRDTRYGGFQSSSPTRYLIYCKYEQYFPYELYFLLKFFLV